VENGEENVNQVQVQKGKLALQPYEDRPVGCPPEPDRSAMTKEELKACRDTVGRLDELVKKSKKGDKKAVPEIREILKGRPELAWRIMNFARFAEWHFMNGMFKDENLASKKVLERQLAAMREEIAGANPSPLERLLAERIVLTWLQIQLFEGLYAANMLKSTTIAQGNYHQKRLDQTYRRYLSAIRMLAQIRKMGPAVQINIAEKQINTAG
jgi:hypothetical protein